MPDHTLQTAYILLWFPCRTETFIFREVVNLKRFGLPLKIYSLYGSQRKLGREMANWQGGVHRLGSFSLLKIIFAFFYWLTHEPIKVGSILRVALFRRWRGLEKTAENIWALLAGFYLARQFQYDGIEHIHAPWAGGPATAAWVASRLIEKPFSFTGRAWDIYPADALISQKIDEAIFVRTETMANVRHLINISGAEPSKFHVTYNGVPLEATRQAELAMREPFRLFAMGRFVEKKGFEYLIRALPLLIEKGFDVELTLAGDGALRRKFERLSSDLGVHDKIKFTGFLTYETVADAFLNADAFVMPCVVSRSGDRDGIPTVLLEALLHGVPVVTTAVSGIPELVTHGETGLIVPERDPQAISDALAKLFNNRSYALHLASKGRDLVREKFDADRNHRKIFELYSKIS